MTLALGKGALSPLAETGQLDVPGGKAGSEPPARLQAHVGISLCATVNLGMGALLIMVRAEHQSGSVREKQINVATLSL